MAFKSILGVFTQQIILPISYFCRRHIYLLIINDEKNRICHINNIKCN